MVNSICDDIPTIRWIKWVNDLIIMIAMFKQVAVEPKDINTTFKNFNQAIKLSWLEVWSPFGMVYATTIYWAFNQKKQTNLLFVGRFGSHSP